MQIVPPLYLLQTLVVFSEQGNLVQTAERLGLTQPTVSRQLQQLEELFEHPLFRTQGRNKVLTDYGSALVQELRERFVDLERIFQKVDQTFAQSTSIHVSVGGRKEILDRYFSQVSFPGTLELIHMTGNETVEALKKGSLDIGITQQNFDSLNFLGKKLFLSGTALIIPKRWAHDISNPKDWAEKASQYGAAAYSVEQSLLKDYFDHHKTTEKMQINCIVADWNSIEKRVSQGKSWAVIPSDFVTEGKGYEIFQLGTHFPSTQFYVYYRKDLAKAAWMKDLLGQVFESST